MAHKIVISTLVAFVTALLFVPAVGIAATRPVLNVRVVDIAAYNGWAIKWYESTVRSAYSHSILDVRFVKRGGHPIYLMQPGQREHDSGQLGIYKATVLCYNRGVHTGAIVSVAAQRDIVANSARLGVAVAEVASGNHCVR